MPVGTCAPSTIAGRGRIDSQTIRHRTTMVDVVDVAARSLALKLRLMVLAVDTRNGFLSESAICNESDAIRALFGVDLNHRYCLHDRDPIALWQDGAV